jgi:hypothetical protein
MSLIDLLMRCAGVIDAAFRPPVRRGEYLRGRLTQDTTQPLTYLPPENAAGVDENEDVLIRAVPEHNVGISSVSATISTEFKWTVSNTLTGGNYNPTTNAGDLRKSQGFGTNVSNTTSGGGDEVFSFQQAISPGSSATIDLTAMTNLLQQTGVSIARIKGIQFRVLSGSDDTTLSPTPTSTSTVTVSNEGLAVPCQLDFGNGGSGLTLALTTSGGAITSVALGAAGSGYPPSNTFLVTPNQSGGSGALVAVTTNGSGVPTTAALVAGTGGAGYTNATVPTTVVGHYNILTGGAHMYFDPAANGFCTTDATHKNVKLYNLDGSNAVTVEVDVLAATT